MPPLTEDDKIFLCVFAGSVTMCCSTDQSRKVIKIPQHVPIAPYLYMGFDRIIHNAKGDDWDRQIHVYRSVFRLNKKHNQSS